jgi:hypothetical protein
MDLQATSLAGEATATTVSSGLGNARLGIEFDIFGVQYF